VIAGHEREYATRDLRATGCGAGLGSRSWCGKRRPELEAQRIITDPHSPPKFRINGPLSNLPEFAAAFQCKPGTKMVRQDACTVW
jgi:putative endopeptidase